MARANACSDIAVEVFIEKYVVSPIWIFLELLCASVNRTFARFIAQENPCQAVSNFVCNFEQVHLFSRSCRELNLKVVAIIQIEAEQRPDDEHIHGHPNRPAPIRISAEHSGIRFSRKIADRELLTLYAYHIRMIRVITRHRPYPIRAEKFVLIEHASQYS